VFTYVDDVVQWLMKAVHRRPHAKPATPAKPVEAA
jgi:hypothetical protein